MDLAAAFKALGHPHRLLIYKRLAKLCNTKCDSEEGTAACISDAGDGLQIAPSTLSHHIKALKNANLLILERSGQKSVCTINQKILKQLQCFFKEMGKCK